MKVKDFERATALTKARGNLLHHRHSLSRAKMFAASFTLAEGDSHHSLGLTLTANLANHVYVTMTAVERDSLTAQLLEIVQRDLGQVELELTKLGVEIE